MDAKLLFDYVWLGGAMRFLADVQQGWQPNDRNGLVTNGVGIEETLTALNLPVTMQAWRRTVSEPLAAWAAKDTDYELNRQEADDFGEEVKIVRAVLEAECLTKVAYVPSEKRFDVRRLLDDAPSLLAPDAFQKLPDVAAHDMREAGRAIAFNLPTAAAFHLLRATEATLRAYYLNRVRRGRVRPLLWGPMVASLRSRRRPPDPVLISNLDNIRLAFRNPTAHPEKVYDIDEAQDLFGLCIEVLNRMARELPPRTT